ncbi:MAG: glycosyltransferase family 4 protein [Candidatus Sumerlaeaceae bacterium]|nr:glycosyltransferase family 4 protein [Candidatus Sumerlaeaceae bacterium]
MKRVRVLHITPSVRLLGARRSLLTLVKELAGTRFEPLVLVPRQGALTEELDKRHLRWIALELPPWRKGSSWLTMHSRLIALRNILHQEKIDLIHCNEIYPNPHAVVASSDMPLWRELFASIVIRRSLRGPLVPVVTHNRLSVSPRMIQNYLLGDSTRIIAVSHAAAKDFAQEAWFGQKVRVVYNGIEFDEFERAKSRRDEVRARLGFDPSDVVFGMVGLLMPRKRPQFLLDASPDILARVPRARFLFVGDPSPRHEYYAEELRKRAHELGISDRVTFLPFQERVAGIFAAMDVHVLLSNEEGFGRVVIEAAAAGIPTIGSRVGGIQELIVDNETGFLIGNENAFDDKEFWKHMSEFVEAATLLACDANRRRAMGLAAYEHCLMHFSSEQYVHGVVRVFQEALEEIVAQQPPW